MSRRDRDWWLSFASRVESAQHAGKLRASLITYLNGTPDDWSAIDACIRLGHVEEAWRLQSIRGWWVRFLFQPDHPNYVPYCRWILGIGSGPCMDDVGPNARNFALEILGYHVATDIELLDPLVSALETGNELEQKAAIDALGEAVERGQHEALPVLSRVALNAGHPARRYAVHKLARLGREPRPGLREVLADVADAYYGCDDTLAVIAFACIPRSHQRYVDLLTSALSRGGAEGRQDAMNTMHDLGLWSTTRKATRLKWVDYLMRAAMNPADACSLEATIALKWPARQGLLSALSALADIACDGQEASRRRRAAIEGLRLAGRTGQRVALLTLDRIARQETDLLQRDARFALAAAADAGHSLT